MFCNSNVSPNPNTSGSTLMIISTDKFKPRVVFENFLVGSIQSVSQGIQVIDHIIKILFLSTLQLYILAHLTGIFDFLSSFLEVRRSNEITIVEGAREIIFPLTPSPLTFLFDLWLAFTRLCLMLCKPQTKDTRKKPPAMQADRHSCILQLSVGGDFS